MATVGDGVRVGFGLMLAVLFVVVASSMCCCSGVGGMTKLGADINEKHAQP